MAQRLVAIANSTGRLAEYSSTEYFDDACAVPGNGVIHSGGKDDDYVLIADCSDSSYYQKHHCTVEAEDGSWVVTFWNDDNDGHLLYWSPGKHFSHANPVAGSKDWLEVALLVGPGPVAYWTQWT